MPVKAHYISGTHWDREWYRPFQEFRFLLVEVLDDLIKLMENDTNFKFFHLDGQTCILKDYLEIRPEQKERLSKLIIDGKILIGPWFTMPDLFAVGQESLIRNLLLGKTICESWHTKPMPIGYVCDMFGHPSQMPQIYSGFNYEFCVLGRGTIEDEVPAFFKWKSKNGSTVFVYKLQDELGYGAFIKPRNFLENEPIDKIKAVESIENYINHEIKRTNGNVVCLFDSMDHKPPATDTIKYISLVKEAVPEIETEHSNLIDFFNDAKKSASDIPEISGELRRQSKARSPYNWLIPNCTSARIRMKQKNDRCQNLLINWVEPFLFFANNFDANITLNFLNHCWENLLLNHAHDSICGCSIDQVHKDMDYRFDQVLILSEALKNRSLGFISQKLKELSTTKDEFTLIICNPLPVSRKEVFTFNIDFPVDYPTFYTEGFGGNGSQKINSFTIHLPDGNEINYQKLKIIPRFLERTRYAKTTTEGGDGICSRYKIAAEFELPPLGMTTLLVKPSNQPTRNFGSLLTSPFTAENEFIELKINSNGSVNIIDKISNEVYENLLLFEDKSEIGSGWFHSATLNDELINSYGNSAIISIVEDGEFLVTFKISLELKIPKSFDYINETRSNEKGKLTIINFITLKKGASHLEIKTLIDNKCENHLLKLLIPTSIKNIPEYYTHTHFDIVERNIEIDKNTKNWQEVEILQKPFLDFIVASDKKRGLAFICGDGLHEGGLRDDKVRTMEITLLRSFSRTVGTLGESEGLEKGKIELNYILLPFSGKMPLKTIFRLSEKNKSDITSFQTGKISSGFPQLCGEEIHSFSILEFLDYNLVLSSFKPTENKNEAILRVWNPDNEKQVEHIHFFNNIINAKIINLAEDEINSSDRIFFDNQILSVSANPFEIITVKILLGN